MAHLFSSNIESQSIIRKFGSVWVLENISWYMPSRWFYFPWNAEWPWWHTYLWGLPPGARCTILSCDKFSLLSPPRWSRKSAFCTWRNTLSRHSPCCFLNVWVCAQFWCCLLSSSGILVKQIGDTWGSLPFVTLWKVLKFPRVFHQLILFFRAENPSDIWSIS